MNRRMFGKITIIGAIAAMAKGADRAGLADDLTSKAEKKDDYQPTLKSIRAHATPEWFQDLKFGMFIDYGLYSVAGYAPKLETGAMYPDWYLYNMYHIPEVVKYHREKWGPNFERDDFIPLFKAENYDPDGIAKIAEDAGMRYVVPFCKHHDGFCLWPSSYTKRNTMDMGPKRDLIGPLSEACKIRGLKFGFYFSLEEWDYPILKNGKKMLRTWLSRWEVSKDKPGFELTPYDEAAMAGKVTGKILVQDFVGDYIVPQAKEFIDNYDPDILWLDGAWATPIEQSGSPEIVSYLYNRAEGRKTVATNDRLGLLTRYNVGDFFTSEYGSHNIERTQILHKWEECRGISQSFGFNWQDTSKNVISAGELVDKLVKIVSENGNLLLVVNLDGTGAMPEYIRARLHDIGQWLKINGEAIYGSRPWYIASQGEKIRFTQSKDGRYLYVIHKGWPEPQLEVLYLLLDNSSKIMLLSSGQELKWKNVPEGDDGNGKGGKVVIEIPEALRDTVALNYAVTLRIELTD